MHVRAMRGGSQAQLMLADNGAYYVVKFSNNPQGTRVLANEWIAGRLAQRLGLAVPVFEQIYVSQDLIERSPGLALRVGGYMQPCMSGVQFGSRLLTSTPSGAIFEGIPPHRFESVSNISDFVGALVLDKWTCNTDARQVVFCRPKPQKPIQMYLIDNGFCFNGGEWTFPDSPIRGRYARPEVYDGVTGWESFEPWLGNVESFSERALYSIGDEIPPAWYNGWGELQQLLGHLVMRRSIVRRLLWEFKNNSRAPFPFWFERPKGAAFRIAV